MEGGLGAPLLPAEIEELQKSYKVVKDFLPREHVETIERLGLFEHIDGEYTTMCYNNKACVFVYYDGSVAKCSIEKSYLDGKLKWRKPISCHLFPLRIKYNGFTRLYYQRISECDVALEQGKRENIYLSDFLKDSLIRAFGNSWYVKFNNLCQNMRINNKNS